MKTRLFILFIFSAVLVSAQSKAPAQPELESGSIESQMTYIIEKSSSFKDFQLIRKTSILKVKENVLDSLKTMNSAVKSTQGKVVKLEAEIAKLKNEIQALNNQVAETNEQVDAIMVFGNPVEKTLYNSIMWGAVIVLLLVLIFFALRFKSSNSVTKKTRHQLEKLENEYETFRKKSLKKEQEIMRKLQDEINKNNP